MSASSINDAETTPSQIVVSSTPRLPVEGQPPLPPTSYSSSSTVGQVPMKSTVSDSIFFDYFPYKDLIMAGSYKRQLHSVKPKTSGYMLYASTMHTTIKHKSAPRVGWKGSTCVVA